ncbi:MAG: amidohydrolase [Pirellulales bacterium]|nr:amidohydrolase [Pirellulales bacterium]
MGPGWSRRRFVQGVVGFSALSLAGGSGRAEKPAEGYIDAHVHVWTSSTERYPLKPDMTKDRMAVPSFTPEELFAHARPCSVERIVLIQMSYYGADNSYMLDSMRRFPGVFGGVAIVDENARPRAAMLALAEKGVRGFRLRPADASGEYWLDSPAMAAMWKCGAENGLAMCLLIDPQHLPAIGRMAQKYPDTPVVIDHFARIGADGEIRPQDVDSLCGLAKNKKVHVKVSAFYALGKKASPYLDLAPMVRRLLDSYGPERLMWATDCPFQIMNGHTYRDSLELIRTRLDFLTETDRRWLLRKTAQRLFFQGAE